MSWRRTSLLLGLCALLALAIVSCSNEPQSPVATTNVPDTSEGTQTSALAEQTLTQMATAVNNHLEAVGADYRLAVAEWYGGERPENMRTIYFWNVGDKQLSHHWVPGDPRRAGWSSGTSISYTVDTTEGATLSGLTSAQTTAAIHRAMATWDRVLCSTIPLNRLADQVVDVGFVQWINGLGGDPNIYADITHAGWFPPGILANTTIAVTFTYIWVNGGVPTDIDNNGKRDTAFREIYYNDLFNWQINPGCQLCPLIDVETVALHEAGHGLSQAHFGAAFRDSGAGYLHFAPHAVMNSGYSGQNQTITETDLAGHCSIWAHWPNN